MNNKLLLYLMIVTSCLSAQDNSRQTIINTDLKISCQHKKLLEALMREERDLLKKDKALRFSYTLYDQKLDNNLKKICIGSFPIFLIGSYCYLAMQKKEAGDSIEDKRKYDALNSLVTAVLGTVTTGLIGTVIVDVIKRSSYPARFMLDQKIMAKEGMLTRLKQNVLQDHHENQQ